ncbi:MAG: 4Fe-4S dicluster domain-containing protein [Coriobacteriia bacterium]|nr:4Fe-4S dicluster domain-containing protein [Coriobacteriia bacterium]
MWGKGLINGLRLSLKNAMRGPITVQYPYEKLELPERARWAVRPKYFDDGSPRCTACMVCVRTCPDHILSFDFEVREDKTKHINAYTYEIGACMMCGLCVEACPFDAIEMSHDYELAVIDPGRLTEDLLQDVDAATNARHKAEKEHAAAAATPEPAEDGDAS